MPQYEGDRSIIPGLYMPTTPKAAGSAGASEMGKRQMSSIASLAMINEHHDHDEDEHEEEPGAPVAAL